MNLSPQKWFAAAYTGLVAAAYCCLLINGFVGFQFAEDGTPLSLWVRITIWTSPYPIQTNFLSLVLTYNLPTRIRCLLFRRHSHLQTALWIFIHQTHRSLHSLHHLACRLRSHLHHLSTHPRLPYTWRQMADRRYHLWYSILCWRSSVIVRVQCDDLWCDQALYWRIVLLHTLCVVECDDGL